MSEYTPLLLYGYQRARLAEIRRLSVDLCGSVTAADIYQPGRPLSVQTFREAIRFGSVAPVDRSSRARVIVLDMEECGRSEQSALLKAVEEPPKTTQYILHAPTLDGILQTIVSRCLTKHFPTPARGQLMADLVKMGMDAERVVFMAQQLGRGYDVATAPSAEDFRKADQFLRDGGRDPYKGVRSVMQFDQKTIAALRQRLLERGEISLIAQTYVSIDPISTGYLLLREMRKANA